LLIAGSAVWHLLPVLQEQGRVLLVTLAAATVLLVVGIVNLWQVVDKQQLW
jgi:hypothetical protein